ncbi:hypothetical protein [Aeromicrobium alkaliterrae]|uniref:Uncharacterized protein n=1 Tax=Aeromicrobium alkaliterrae TaxID=302168 RepID=A0ABN2K605_9ACTN
MSELMKLCPECDEGAAVHLGDVDGFALYSCVMCDAELQVALTDEDEPSPD